MKYIDKKMSRQVTDLDKLFANHTSDKYLLSKICIELSKLNSKK